MVQSPSWEANWSAAKQETPRSSYFLRNTYSPSPLPSFILLDFITQRIFGGEEKLRICSLATQFSQYFCQYLLTYLLTYLLHGAESFLRS